MYFSIYMCMHKYIVGERFRVAYTRGVPPEARRRREDSRARETAPADPIFSHTCLRV